MQIVQIADDLSQYATAQQLQQHQYQQSTVPLAPNQGIIAQSHALIGDPLRQQPQQQTMLMTVNPMDSVSFAEGGVAAFDGLGQQQQQLLLGGGGQHVQRMEPERHFFPPVNQYDSGAQMAVQPYSGEQQGSLYQQQQAMQQSSGSAPMMPSMRSHSVQQQHQSQHFSFSSEFANRSAGYPGYPHSSLSNYPDMTRRQQDGQGQQQVEEEDHHHFQRRRLASYPMHESAAAQYHRQLPLLYHRRDYAYHPTQAHYQQQKGLLVQPPQPPQPQANYSAYQREADEQAVVDDIEDVDVEVDVGEDEEVDVDMEVDGLLAHTDHYHQQQQQQQQHHRHQLHQHPNHCTSTESQQQQQSQMYHRQLAYPDYSNHPAGPQAPFYPSHSSTFPSNGGKRQFGGMPSGPAGGAGGGGGHGGRSTSSGRERPRVMTAPMNANEVYLFEAEEGMQEHSHQHAHHQHGRLQHATGAGPHRGHSSRTVSQSEPPPSSLEQRQSSAYGQQSAYEMTDVSSSSAAAGPVAVMGQQPPPQGTEVAPYSPHVRLSYEVKKLL